MTDFLDGYEDDELDEIIERQNERKKPTQLDIPEFLSKKSEMELPTEEQLMAHAMLNNTPNNAEIENMQHLDGMELKAQNFTSEEWKRILYYVPSKLMTEEMQRRLSAAEEYRKAMVDADEVMRRLKL